MTQGIPTKPETSLTVVHSVLQYLPVWYRKDGQGAVAAAQASIYCPAAAQRPGRHEPQSASTMQASPGVMKRTAPRSPVSSIP